MNWRDEETLYLVELVRENYTTIKGKFSPLLTLHMKRQTWSDITAAVNATYGNNRLQAEVEKKWQNTKTAALQKRTALKNAMTKTGQYQYWNCSLCACVCIFT